MSKFDDQSVASSAPSTDYAIVDVTKGVCEIIARRGGGPLSNSFNAAGPPPVPTVGPGDVVSVTIWEAGTGGLFAAPIPTADGGLSLGARAVTLPDQVVSPLGTLSVPYAGQIAAIGLEPAEIERLIARHLKDKATEPQVMVGVRSSNGNSVTLAGDAVAGSRLMLNSGGYRVLDAIALAGGLKTPAHEVVVRLTRSGKTASMTYAELLAAPDENVYLRGGDVLTVVRIPRTFTALGASGGNGVIPFDRDNLSLEEAVGKMGGLLDHRADPSAVYVFRLEDASLAREMVPARVRPEATGSVPVIYHIDLETPSSYFCARQFAMADKDIVYVANADLNDLQKFLNIIGSVLAPVATGANVAN